MNLLELSRLGAHHLRNRASEEIYLRTELDTTVPISIYGEIVERCNYKCRYCDYWRRPSYREEMSIDEWKAALIDLKGFIGHFHIEFSGGEPYVKKGFIDLIRFCGNEEIKWGVTTNGGAFLNQKIVEQTVAARRSISTYRSTHATRSCTIIRAEWRTRCETLLRGLEV